MKSSRRSFLSTIAAIPFLSPIQRYTMARPDDSTYDPWIEVSAAHLRWNVDQVSRRVAGRPILAVIKNNGYGLGVVNVARILEPLSAIAGFAVVKLNEAVTLRDAGIAKPILSLGPFSESELEEMVGRSITPMIYTPVESMLDKVSRKLNATVTVHVCVDTGIGRVGVPFRKAPSLLRSLAARSSVRIEGTMMTFTEDPDFDKEQLQRFRSLCDGLEKEGIGLGKKHAASTFGLFQIPEAFLDMVRPGMALFGMYPEQEFRTMDLMDLKPAVALRAKVIYVKRLEKGESAGYDRVFHPKEERWVATIPVGHADGYPRSATKGARVRIGKNRFPVVAISASHTIVDLGTQTSVRVGDTATMFDWSTGSRPEDVNAECGSSVYDLTMHLNPLLPRKVLA